MLLGVSQMRAQSYNSFSKSPNPINTLIISKLTVWHISCCNLVLEENSCKLQKISFNLDSKKLVTFFQNTL